MKRVATEELEQAEDAQYTVVTEEDQELDQMLKDFVETDTVVTEDPVLTGRPPNMLSLSCDADYLSPYQVLVRKQIELFEAHTYDVETGAQGRNKPIVLGQVGIRCRHCTHIPPKDRSRGAAYYPTKLLVIYQAAQNLANSHLCESCPHVPVEVREQLCRLRDQKSGAGGGKQHWADTAKALGVYEDQYGLRYERKFF